MKPGLPAMDTSLQTSADYVPGLIKDRKVHFTLEELEEEDAANAKDEVASEHDAECDGDEQEESLSSEEESSDCDTNDITTDASSIDEDITTVQDESHELRGSPDPSPTDDLNIDQLFQQFIEVGQCPLLKLRSLDRLTR